MTWLLVDARADFRRAHTFITSRIKGCDGKEIGRIRLQIRDLMGRDIAHRNLCSPGDDRPDFDLILVGEHFFFGDQFIAANDQMRFDHEIQFSQDILRPFRALDVQRAGGMAELDMHRGIICFQEIVGQGWYR